MSSVCIESLRDPCFSLLVFQSPVTELQGFESRRVLSQRCIIRRRGGGQRAVRNACPHTGSSLPACPGGIPGVLADLAGIIFSHGMNWDFYNFSVY